MADTAVQRRAWTAEESLATDQHEFGDAWRYDLVDGKIVAPVAPNSTRRVLSHRNE